MSDAANCALCAGPGDGEVTEYALTHGVTVLLCALHRSERFQRQSAGDDLADALAAMWAAAGCLTDLRRAALQAHTRRTRRPRPARPQPGSYAWPALRREAERRYAAGEPPSRVIHELRQASAGTGAVAPSYRTLRRWYTEARWMQPPAPDQPYESIVERTFEWVDGLRRHGEPYGWAVCGWPRHDRYGHPYRRR